MYIGTHEHRYKTVQQLGGVLCVILCSLCHTVFPGLVTDVCGDIFTVWTGRFLQLVQRQCVAQGTFAWRERGRRQRERKKDRKRRGEGKEEEKKKRSFIGEVHSQAFPVFTCAWYTWNTSMRFEEPHAHVSRVPSTRKHRKGLGMRLGEVS